MPDDLIQPSGTKELTKEGILDILNSEDLPDDESKEDLLAEKEPIKEKEETKKEEELDLEELGEDEKDEAPEDEQLELRTPVRRKEILAKYPTLFKDFPYLETAYYREQQYTEILPTIDDAKEAVERAETLAGFEKDLKAGNSESVLKTVKENDPDAFGRLVDNYLSNLGKVDQTAYYHVVGNVVNSTIQAMVQEAQRINNEDLKAAALILNQFVYGNSEFKQSKNFGKPESAPSKELENEKQQFARERFESARDDLTTKVNNILTSTISTNLDPKGSMTDYLRKNATRDCLNNLESSISQDTRFRSVLDSLWKKAFESNFSKDSLDKIRSAYLSKAKTLLPQLIQRTRNEALRGLNKGNREEKDRKGPLAKGMSTTPSKDSGTKQTIPRGMRTVDYFLQGD